MLVVDFCLKEDYLDDKDGTIIQHENPNNFWKLENIYLGRKVMAVTQSMTGNQTSANKKVFRNNCLNFLIHLADWIYTRWPFKNNDT